MMWLLLNLLLWGAIGAALLGMFGVVVQAISVGFIAFGLIILCMGG